MKQTIIDAIKGRNLLEFSYDGHQRVVEPHTFGVSTKGNDSLSAYQVEGQVITDSFPIGNNSPFQK